MASGIDLIKGTSEVSGTEIVDKAGLPATAYDDLMESASREHGVPYEVLYRNLKQESGFNPKVVSPTGARGIAQFNPSTAKAMGIKDPHDPKEAIPGSAKYLRQLYDQFGDWKLAVAAYNAGPIAVSKAKGIPNKAETQKHVKVVFPGDVGEPVFDPKETQAAMSGLDLLKPQVNKVPEPSPNVLVRPIGDQLAIRVKQR